jgi:urease accessory protein
MAKNPPALPCRSSPRKRGPRVVGNTVLEPAFSSEAASLYRLMAWLSPAYPVGAFTYSTGLEWAVEAGDVTCPHTLSGWLTAFLTDGSGFCDAVLFTQAYRACETGNDKSLFTIAELATALAPSRERFLETTAQGRAFLEVTRAAWPCPLIDRLCALQTDAIAYPVAVGVAAAGHAIPLEPSLSVYLQSLVANWISAGVRLIPLGQTDGQRVTAALEPIVAATAVRALATSFDEIGGASFRSDIAAMRHETQYTRLFRS